MSFACHATVLNGENLMLSAEFPGVACRLVSEQTGAPALYLQGACGNVNPMWIRQDFESVERAGQIVGGAGAAVVAELQALGPGQRAHNIRWDEFPEKPVPGAHRRAAAEGGAAGDRGAAAGVPRGRGVCVAGRGTWRESGGSRRRDRTSGARRWRSSPAIRTSAGRRRGRRTPRQAPPAHPEVSKEGAEPQRSDSERPATEVQALSLGEGLARAGAAGGVLRRDGGRDPRAAAGSKTCWSPATRTTTSAT